MIKKDNSQKSKEYKKLKKQLEKYKWNINEKDINLDFIQINKDGAFYVLYLFDGDDVSGVWLADEEVFDGEKPLWFSEKSHVVSPIFSLSNYISSLCVSSTKYQPILVMMPLMYIINVECQLEKWNEIKVISINRLKELISIEGIVDFETDINDICARQDIDVSDNNKKEEVDEDMPIIKDVKIEPILDDETSKYLPSQNTHFREMGKGVLSISFSIDMPNKNSSKPTLKAELHNSEGIIEDDIIFSESSESQFILGFESLTKGSYWIYITCGDKQLYAQEMVIVDIPALYSECIEIGGFGLFRIEQGELEDDLQAAIKRGSQNCFNHNALSGVLSAFVCTSKLDAGFSYQFTTTVFNELGAPILEHIDEGVTTAKNDILSSHIAIRGVVCPTGSYTVRIEFYGETVVEVEFVVGSRDILATYTNNSIQPKTNTAGKGIVHKSDSPLKTLNEMIGLTDLKKQIAELTALAKLSESRKALKLPTKPQQLHFAFMGNPGTGKTTVAKLLGQIYKDVGLLSKGHVVMEERSTLMTQNWGSEGEMVNKALEKARGGILFIDEAYNLVTEHKSDPGRLILSALLSAMSDENNRDIMIILAGYTQPMERLLSINEGLRSRVQKLYFKDFEVDELMQIASLWLGRNCYNLTAKVEKQLRMVVKSAYDNRGESFGNGRYIFNLLEKEILPAMAKRLVNSGEELSERSLTTIEACDIPNYHSEDGAVKSIDKLNAMVGLSKLKGQIRDHLSFIRFVAARRECDIHTSLPPMHMVFTGNPGTGKSSVADYLGEIYRSMGLLSVGHVIKVTRGDIVDGVVGGTELKMKNLINAAHGNILFIDEAYTLLGQDGKGDVGERAIEMLLDALGREACDFIVILAGYPKEMDKLLRTNTGIKGRFPYQFHFEDYTQEELCQIAETVAERNNLTLSNEARAAIAALIRKECRISDATFSNARFVVRLLTTQIMPRMARRLEGVSDSQALRLVTKDDVPIEESAVKMINENLFDDKLISSTLERLNSLVGLEKAKMAIHQFVDFARHLNVTDRKSIENYSLKWSFVGNTGTGKSTVAEILSQLLKAMHLLGKGHTVEVKAEELYGVNTYQADEILRRRMSESLQGLLFIDGDAPQFKSPESRFNPDYLRMCLAANTSEIHGRFAIVVAEHTSPCNALAEGLAKIGINDFDHTLIFDDYTIEELILILSNCLAKIGLSLDKDAIEIMKGYITRLHNDYRSGYANARTMNLIASVIHKIAVVKGIKSNIVTAVMIADFTTPSPPIRKRIGF